MISDATHVQWRKCAQKKGCILCLDVTSRIYLHNLKGKSYHKKVTFAEPLEIHYNPDRLRYANAKDTRNSVFNFNESDDEEVLLQEVSNRNRDSFLLLIAASELR